MGSVCVVGTNSINVRMLNEVLFIGYSPQFSSMKNTYYDGLTRYSLVFILLYWYWEIVVCQINENSWHIRIYKYIYMSISRVSYRTPVVIISCSVQV